MRASRSSKAIGLKGGSVAFTGSATEALNWALKGTRRESRAKGRNRIITVATEHAAVLDTCEWLAGQGSDLTVLPVNRDGRLDLDLLDTRARRRVLLVAVMQVNNEIGVTQPITEIADMAHDAGALMLCDAVQAFGRRRAVQGARPGRGLRAQDPRSEGDWRAVDAQGRRAGAAAFTAAGRSRGCARAPYRRRCASGFGAAAKLADERCTRDYDHVQRLWKAAVHALGPGLDDQRKHDASLSKAISISAAKALMERGLLADLRDIAFSLGIGMRQRLGPAKPRASARSASTIARPLVDPARLRPLHDAAGAGRRLPAASRRTPSRRRSSTRDPGAFFKADGTLDKEVEAAPGQRLLDVAWAAREPLEGACEGVMACSTCHVIVEAADFEKLPRATEEEEDLLDLAAQATRTSRLACQIILTEDMKSLSVRVPVEARQLDGPLAPMLRPAVLRAARHVGGATA